MKYARRQHDRRLNSPQSDNRIPQPASEYLQRREQVRVVTNSLDRSSSNPAATILHAERWVSREAHLSNASTSIKSGLQIDSPNPFPSLDMSNRYFSQNRG